MKKKTNPFVSAKKETNKSKPASGKRKGKSRLEKSNNQLNRRVK
ncbi:MAG: hypothetical protein WCQ82_07245 [Bacteroidaceae bacterium]|nr:hypothetical protein [Bacteroidaceae bacterium]